VVPEQTARQPFAKVTPFAPQTPAPAARGQPALQSYCCCAWAGGVTRRVGEGVGRRVSDRLAVTGKVRVRGWPVVIERRGPVHHPFQLQLCLWSCHMVLSCMVPAAGAVIQSGAG